MTTTTIDTIETQKNSWPRAFWEFTRPHTIIGTTLAVFIFYLLAVVEAGGTHAWLTVFVTYAASLSVNIYIVGLNQLTDVEIDKINKPYLPLAAGSFRWTTGVAIVAVSGVLSLGLAAWHSPYLLATIAVVFTLGSIYSLPPLRLKQRPFWAATSITLARAVVGNAGVYLTYSHALTGEAHLPPHILLFIGFMFGFCIVIALMKDVPDIEGDREHQISTFVVEMGAEKIMKLCRYILAVSYIVMIIAGALAVPGVNPWVLGITHVSALAVMWSYGAKLNVNNGDDVYKYYMLIWKLFYFEFAAFSISCLLG
jgi:homogentisate phytyltransferase / homogentisate geranylgeranyltransferase